MSLQKTRSKKQNQIIQLTLLAMLTALTFVLGWFGAFIPIGGTTLNLALVPVVLGAALCGVWGGGWLGLVSALSILFSGQAAGFMSIHASGTIIIVLAKGILAGVCAGLIYKLLYKLLSKKNKYVATFAAAAACPIVNTLIFIVGCFTFFLENTGASAQGAGMSMLAFVLTYYVTINFIVELAANVILAPTLHRLINIWYKAK